VLKTDGKTGMDQRLTNSPKSDYQYLTRIVVQRGVMIITILCLSFLSFKTTGQTEKYLQWSNEFQFARPFNNMWAGEFWLGATFSNTPNESRVFKTLIQRYGTVWVHYFLPPKWKFSAALSYFYNKDVPDIGQYVSPEWRLTLQPTYYFHKVNYILMSRSRVEFRYLWNADSVFQFKFRFRQMLKFVKPINGKTLRKGIVYFLTSEELLFKPNAKSSGVTFFDRNRFEVGAGYLFTDDIQLELTYVNEFMPRDEHNEMYNIMTLTLSFNNLLLNLHNSLKPKPDKAREAE
jgi:hypothetical protein